MLRRALLPVLLVALGLSAVPADSAPTSRLAGTWSGTMRPTGSAVKSSYTFTITIAKSGKTGTWRSERCRGTLRFVRRRDGYALFKESLTSGPCTGNGTDWVKRRGSGLYVSFKSASGPAANSAGTLSRR